MRPEGHNEGLLVTEGQRLGSPTEDDSSRFVAENVAISRQRLLERSAASECLEQHTAKCPYVSALVDDFAPSLLWRHTPPAENHPRPSHRGAVIVVTYYTVFVIDLARRVQIVGSTPHPHDLFLQPAVRTMTAADDGLLVSIAC
jgi:hypothetical protein